MQKVLVLYDRCGAIISMGAPLDQSVAADAVSFGLIAHEGQFTAELEVPDAYRDLGFPALAQQLQIDMAGPAHRLAPKS